MLGKTYSMWFSVVPIWKAYLRHRILISQIWPKNAIQKIRYQRLWFYAQRGNPDYKELAAASLEVQKMGDKYKSELENARSQNKEILDVSYFSWI